MQLYTGQLIDAAKSQQIEGADALVQVIQQAQGKLADLVAEHHGIAHSVTSYEMGELGSGFGPKTEFQECPQALAEFDIGSDWVSDPQSVEPLVPMVALYQPRADGPIIEVVLDSYKWADDPRPELAGSKLAEPSVNDHNEYPFEIIDQEDDRGSASGIITAMQQGIAVRIAGYTDNASQDNVGELFILIRQKGKLNLIVFGDVNQEEPTHTISLESARNLNRETFTV